MNIIRKILKYAVIASSLLIMGTTGIQAQAPDYLCELRNDVQINARTFEFDVYLLRTGSTEFYYSSMQFGINISSGFRNGGVISVNLVSGSSEFVPAQIPAPDKFSFNAAKSCIIMTATPGPGAAGSTVISNVSPGTRVGRIRLTNTVDFGMVHPDLTWCFSIATGYPTKVNAYEDIFTYEVTVQASHTTLHLVNALLNQIPSALVWNGSVNTSWFTPENWTPNGVPSDLTDVVIPNAATTSNDPVLPVLSQVKTLTLEPYAILNSSPDAQLTVNGDNGAWNSFGGTFNAGTSNVTFTDIVATIMGATNFYDITIADGAGLTAGSGNDMRIEGAMTYSGNGTLNAASFPNTIEFTGDNQTIINPNGTIPGYYNLILSGTGIKTFTGQTLFVAGDLMLSGAASATVDQEVTIFGNLLITEESNLSVAPAGVLNVSGNITRF